MSNYGLHIDGLPLYLGQEQMVILHRKISRREVQTRTTWRNVLRGNNHAEVYLGTSADHFVVFADYKMGSHIFPITSYESRRFHTVSGITDNLLVLRDNNWYLVVFKPLNIDDMWLDTDFYVFRQVRQNEPISERYGLNVYGADGQLRYHSGWRELRLTQSITNLYMIAENGDDEYSVEKPIFSMRDGDFTHNRSAQALADWQFMYGRNIAVGGRKMVNIGYHVSISGSDYQNSTLTQHHAWYAPIIHNGYIRLALAYANLGNMPPQNHAKANSLAYGRFATPSTYSEATKQKWRNTVGVEPPINLKKVLIADIPQI